MTRRGGTQGKPNCQREKSSRIALSSISTHGFERRDRDQLNRLGLLERRNSMPGGPPGCYRPVIACRVVYRGKEVQMVRLQKSQQMWCWRARPTSRASNELIWAERSKR